MSDVNETQEVVFRQSQAFKLAVRVLMDEAAAIHPDVRVELKVRHEPDCRRAEGGPCTCTPGPGVDVNLCVPGPKANPGGD